MTDQEVKKIYNSSRWQQVRDRILLRDRHECQDCIQRLRMAAVTGERLFGEDGALTGCLSMQLLRSPWIHTGTHCLTGGVQIMIALLF